MPFGAVFTSSSGGSVGGPLPFTRIRGQLLVGQSIEPPANAYQTGTQPGGTTGYNGSAAAPLYSFYNRPDSGFYAANQTSSASDIRYSVIGADFLSLSSVGMRMVSTAANTAVPDLVWSNGPLSTAAVQGFIYLPGTSQTPVGAGVATPFVSGTSGSNITYTVPMVFDVTNKKLWFYTSASSWIGLGGSTSGATLFTTSS